MKKHEEQNIWVRQLVAGDEVAYNFFFKEYYPIFVHFALKYVNDIAPAEDVVHDVVVDFYLNRRNFSNLTKLKSFFYSSIRNRAIDHIRHENAKRHYLRQEKVEEESEFFLDAIMEEEIYFLMNKALKTLPEKIHNVYELSLNGKSNEEIAEMLNLSLDSVKSYKKRGKQILKEKLKGLIWFLSISV